ncbi:MAG: VOC family protein [Synechocystis sp.]|nr:VOC family protein [Synechocystis sp.]
MNPFQIPGAFSWSELITNDIEGAKAFYGEIFGWRFKEGKVSNAPYTVIEVAGKEIGGISPLPSQSPTMPPTWGTYVTVEDVEATVQKVEALGGKILMAPIAIPPAACFALIQDPQGANLAVISYGQPA